MKSYFLILRQVISQRRVVDVHKNMVNEQSRVAVHTKTTKLYFDCSTPTLLFQRILPLWDTSVWGCHGFWKARFPFPAARIYSITVYLCWNCTLWWFQKHISVFLVVIIWHLNAIKTFPLQFCNVCLFFQVTRNATRGERVTLTESCLRERILQF